MYKIYLFLLVLICTLLFACNSTPNKHELYRSEVSWQCPEFKKSFYSLNNSLNFSPKVVSVLEESYSKYTCEEYAEFNAENQRRAKVMREELEAESRARRYQFKSSDEHVVPCRREIDGAMYCNEKTYSPRDQLIDAAQAHDRGEYKKAIIILEPLAEGGDVKAQFMLGKMYENGRGVQQDIIEAIRWYSLAAKQGSSMAQSQLGNLYLRGESVPQNYKIALNFFLLAAEQVEPRAMMSLGLLYAKGWGVPYDPIRAYMWFNLFMMFSSQAKEHLVTQDQIILTRNFRDSLTKIMSSDQINKAQELSLQCLNNRFKNC